MKTDLGESGDALFLALQNSFAQHPGWSIFIALLALYLVYHFGYLAREAFKLSKHSRNARRQSSSGIFEQQDNCRRELREMETRAGIAEEAERSRFGPNLRKLYFSVPDRKLRGDLIAKDREIGDLDIKWHQKLVDEAHQRLKAAPLAHREWWYWASVAGCFFIAIGFHLFELPGALAGMLVGYFNGRRMEDNARQMRKEGIEYASRDLKEYEEMLNLAQNAPRTFSIGEAVWAVPDPKSDNETSERVET